MMIMMMMDEGTHTRTKTLFKNHTYYRQESAEKNGRLRAAEGDAFQDPKPRDGPIVVNFRKGR